MPQRSDLFPTPPRGIDGRKFSKWWTAQQFTVDGLPTTPAGNLSTPPGVDLADFLAWLHSARTRPVGASETAPPDLGERLSLTITEATRLTGLSRDKFYELLRAGEVTGFLVGSRRLLDAGSVRAFLRRARGAEAGVLRSPQPKRRSGEPKWSPPVTIAD